MFIIDSIKKLEKDKDDLDNKYNPEPNSYKHNGLLEFMGEIIRTAGLVCNGYVIDESDNSIENHLGQYNDNGEICYDKFDSIICPMFKNIFEGKMTLDDFIEKYHVPDKQELEKIKKYCCWFSGF